MTQPVTIANEAIAIEVWPQLGGKVSSVIDKADNFELMFNYPAELPDVPRYDVSFSTHWYAGWDECFPAVAPSKYVGHPYDGIAVPDHGELWGIPTVAVPAKNGITTVWHGLRFGYRLTRKLYLEDNSLIAQYTAINLAPFDFRFVWALHGLMSMTSQVKLNFKGDRIFRFSHEADGSQIQRPFEWPMCDGTDDLSVPADLPGKRGWKVFSTKPITSPFIIEYPARGRSVRMEFSSDDALEAYWGIWINTGGWAGHRHFRIEPTTGRFDQIDQSIKDNSAGVIPASGRVDWAVKWTLGMTG